MYGEMVLLAPSLTCFQIWSLSQQITFLEFGKGATKRFSSDLFL